MTFIVRGDERTSIMRPIAAVLCVTLLAGCATTEGQRQAQGAAIGGLLGALGGALIGGEKGAAIGLALGAGAGFAAMKMTQVRTAEQDAQLYGMSGPVTTPTVTLRKAAVSPKTIQPGADITLSTDYSLAVPKTTPSANVVTTFVLKHDGVILVEQSSPPRAVTPGGQLAEAAITIPADAPAGTYVVEHRVSAGSTTDVAESTFVIPAKRS